MSGAQFDKAYMNYMVADHKKDVADFQKEAAHANDPDVKNFAQTTLPTLESHLQQAESIAPKQTSAAAKDQTTAASHISGSSLDLRIGPSFPEMGLFLLCSCADSTQPS